jgi:hypothetical protein
MSHYPVETLRPGEARMLYGDILHSPSDQILVLVLFVLLLLAGEVGYRYGRRNRPGTDERARSQVGTIQAATLGLLGLLLGFTFAMAVSRFDSRKQLVVEEASAIRAASLRAQLLPEPQRTEARALLRRYLDARLEKSRGDPAAPAQEGRTESMARLQALLWAQAVAATEQDRRAVAPGLFAQSVNAVIDTADRRDAALDDHVPEGVLLALFFGATLCVGILGYGAGLGSSRTLFAMLALSVLIAVIVLLIVDLDRPRHRLIRVGEQGLIDLRQQLDRARP